MLACRVCIVPFRQCTLTVGDRLTGEMSPSSSSSTAAARALVLVLLPIVLPWPGPGSLASEALACAAEEAAAAAGGAAGDGELVANLLRLLPEPPGAGDCREASIVAPAVSSSPSSLKPVWGKSTQLTPHQSPLRQSVSFKLQPGPHTLTAQQLNARWQGRPMYVLLQGSSLLCYDNTTEVLHCSWHRSCSPDRSCSSVKWLRPVMPLISVRPSSSKSPVTSSAVMMTLR